VQAENRRVL